MDARQQKYVEQSLRSAASDGNSQHWPQSRTARWRLIGRRGQRGTQPKMQASHQCSGKTTPR
eukprot:5411705-Amphidinium_carterae.1